MDKLAAVNSQLNPNSEESMRDEAIMQSLLGLAIEDLNNGIKKFQGGKDLNIIFVDQIDNDVLNIIKGFVCFNGFL